MPTATGRLIEIREHAALIDCPATLRPAPGQYLLASSLERLEVIPTALFPLSRPSEPLSVAGPFPADWAVGEALHLRGPLGRGFHLPPGARRVAFTSATGAERLLLPLTAQALEQGAAVTLYSAQPPLEYPPDVEILPLESLAGSLTWADYLAACLSLADLAALRARLRLSPRESAHGRVETLILAPMPCGGLAECGVCAVPTRSGWKHACSDGPVLNLDDLEVP